MREFPVVDVEGEVALFSTNIPEEEHATQKRASKGSKLFQFQERHKSVACLKSLCEKKDFIAVLLSYPDTS